MLAVKSRSIRYLAIGLSTLVTEACTKNSSGQETSASAVGPRSFASADVVGFADIPALAEQKAVIRADLKDQFCIHVYKLPMKSDFSKELAILCEAQKPIAGFDQFDRHAALVGDTPRAVRLSLSHGEDGFTSAMFGTVYRVPIVPKWVRSARIPYYMTGASQFSYLKRTGEVTQDQSGELGGDLQFGKWQLSYHADITTPSQTQFSNGLKTELNSFQVQGGNSDIGIGAEHLVEKDNPDFRVYNTTTVTIGNEDKVSSTLITIIRVEVKNNGFPETAEKVISDSATALATHVHDGLMQELAAGNFRQ